MAEFAIASISPDPHSGLLALLSIAAVGRIIPIESSLLPLEFKHLTRMC